MWRASLSLIPLLLLAGCSVHRRPPSRSPDVICWSGGAPSDGAADWLVEARKRFANPLIVSGHGWTRRGEWFTSPDHTEWRGRIAMVAVTLHAAFPDRQIVIVACNPDGLALHVPGCWYCRRSVWCRPGPEWRVEWDLKTHACAGSIWEFQEGKH